MTKIERTLKELDDMRQFYFQIKNRKRQQEPSNASSNLDVTVKLPDHIPAQKPSELE